MEVASSTFIIYRVISPNDKSYIGQTINFAKRQKDHVRQQSGSLLHRAILKYGVESFTWEVLEYCEHENDLDDAEIFWIAWYDSQTPNGYNLTEGGKRGKRTQSVSDETREKLRNGRLGKRHSDESKQKISCASQGRVPSQETREKLRAVHLGRHLAPFTEEHRKNIGLSHRGMRHSEKTRKQMSKSHFGKPHPSVLTESGRANIIAAHLGKKASEATRQKKRDTAARKREERKLSGALPPKTKQCSSCEIFVARRTKCSICEMFICGKCIHSRKCSRCTLDHNGEKGATKQ